MNRQELQDRLKTAEAEIAEVKRLMQEKEEAKSTSSPKWEDLEEIKGSFITEDTYIWDQDIYYNVHENNRNIFPTREQAEATIAEAQLLQLRDSKFYRNGWKPNWNDDTIKYVVCIHLRSFISVSFSYSAEIWSFQDQETRDRFLTDQRELLEIWAKKVLS